MALSEVHCLIGQAACGRFAGNPVCPKCGMDERVVYPGQADREAAQAAALARYAGAHEAVKPPPPPEPPISATLPEPQTQPSKQSELESPAAPMPEKKGVNRLGVGVLALALMGGGWWWKDQQDQRVRLAQEQAASQAQAAEQARSEREAALPRANEAEAKRVAAEKAQAQNAQKIATNETAAPQPTNVAASPRRLSFEPEMVRISAGSFAMGSPASEPGRASDEGPQHSVRVAAFELGKTEVTFKQWDACVADKGCSHRADDYGWGRGNRPVIFVSWNDITGQYIPWLNRKTGKSYRLPSEAEWEYAARAGCSTAFNVAGTCKFALETSDANFESGVKGNSPEKTLPVGSFSANSWGLYDMHGNVEEWVQDCWNDNYVGAPRVSSAWELGDCDRRVVRGGNLLLGEVALRSASRGWNPADSRYDDWHVIGFRLARTVP